MSPQEALSKYFGYDSFRQNQLEIIEAIINGDNALAVLPTGAGKSLCYQIPSIIAKNFSIVISPLIALMKDQVDALNRNEETAAFINSTQSFYESEEILQKLAYGKIKILYVAPERLSNLDFAERIKKLQPSYLFVDEAHCISEWGHNFRPSYRKINEFADYISIKKISAFTATATPEVVKDIAGQLKLESPKYFVRGFERDNLELNVVVTKRKMEKCLELISQFKTPAIIYTASRKMAEEVSEFLNFNRINSAFYHAGMMPLQRKRIQEDFINDKIKVIVATNAFGMGIDKKDIRLIIHYNTPGSIENYYQEIGRAGRDGKLSYAFLLHEDDDINIQNYFLSTSHPDKKLIENIYNAICDYGKIATGNISDREIPINMEFISSLTGKKISNGLLHSTLKILEEAGYLKLVSDYDRKPQIQFNTGRDQLKEFVKNTSNTALKETVLQLIRNFGGDIFREKIKLSLTELASKLETDQKELEGSLIILENLGLITYKKSTAKENAVLITPRIEAKKLRIDYKKLNESYLRLQKKIDTIINYVFSGDCRFRFILKYFGEDVKEYHCGRCDHCKSGTGINELNSDYVKEIILKTINSAKDGLNEKMLFAILRGLDDSLQYKSLEGFGSCGNYDLEGLKNIFHELVERNYISKRAGLKNNLSLTVNGKKIIQQFESIAGDIYSEENYEINIEIFNLLREVRSRAAKKFVQSGYLICPDEVLRTVAQQRPKTRHELFKINGFTERMFNKVGDEFIEVIKNFDLQIDSPFGEKTEPSKHAAQFPANINETLKLLKKEYSLKDIAQLRQLSEAVISMQVETILEYYPGTNISHLFEGSQLSLIEKEIKNGYTDLKELKDKLPKEITYPLIRIAVAKNKFRVSSASVNSTHLM
ncbi:MAG: RecQ family ATP-dependent DNA helicase [Ignavibacteriaceae bacterium]